MASGRNDMRGHWDSRYADSELVWSTEPNVFVRREVEGMIPGRALDLGTGEGRNAIWLAEQGWDVTGVDFSEAGLAKAERLAGSRDVRVTWVLADLLEFEPEPGAFDLVLLVYLHLPAEWRRTVLVRAAAALAPGGTLLIVGHDRSNLEEGVGGPRDPAVLYTAEELIGDLPPGLEVERAERVTRTVEAEGHGGPGVALDALVRARRPAG